MKKILSLIKYVLLAISVITVALLFFMPEAQSVGTMLTWAYIILGIAVVVTVVMPLINVAQNPKGIMRSLIGIGVVAVVLIISYALSSAEPVVDSAGGYFTNPTELKLSDTGLIATYIALGGAILVTIVGEIISSFK